MYSKPINSYREPENHLHHPVDDEIRLFLLSNLPISKLKQKYLNSPHILHEIDFIIDCGESFINSTDSAKTAELTLFLKTINTLSVHFKSPSELLNRTLITMRKILTGKKLQIDVMIGVYIYHQWKAGDIQIKYNM